MSGRLTAFQLDRLADAVRASAGLVFTRSRRPLLHRAALEAMSASGLADPDEFVRLVCNDETARSRLAARATVGETYLFRYGEQLDAVRRQVIDPLVAERGRETRPSVRVWSAGCSGGEEAYTLAILFAEAVTDLERWDIRVVGTDLNGAALGLARSGVYGRWSMRGSWAAHRRWLMPTEDGVRIAPEIRRLVSFEEHNLASLPALPRALLGAPIDLVVCRNVMIYLDAPAISRILDGFHRSLASGGWLVVAPVETSIGGLRQRFEIHQSAAGTLYRRPAGRPAGAGAGRTMPPPAGRPSATVAVRGARRRPVPIGQPPPPGAVDDLLTAARALADAGRLAEARARCLELLRQSPGSIDGHLLLASIAEAQDDLDGAFDSLRRTLYLDPANAAAQFRLGLLEWRRGGTKRAAARLQRAAQLVEGYADDETIDASQLTAARLRSVVEALVV